MVMTSYERVANTLARKPVDQSPFVIGPWPDADKRWRAEGNIPADADMREYLSLQRPLRAARSQLRHHPLLPRKRPGHESARKNIASRICTAIWCAGLNRDPNVTG